MHACMHLNFGDVTLQRLNRFICVIEYILTQNLQSQSPADNNYRYVHTLSHQETTEQIHNILS